MTLNDVLRLIDAGFTKEDILSMRNENNAQEAPEVAKTEEKTESEEQKQPEYITMFTNTVKSFQDTVNELQKTIQRTNRLTASAPTETPKSDVDVLAEILGGTK